MASFSSPNLISSPSLPSSSRALSRSATAWRSASGIARPPYGCGTRIDSRSSGCWSKNCGWLRRKRAISSAFIAFSYLDRSLEDGLRGALHPHRIVAAGPRDGQRSAARRHLHGRIEQAAQDARHDRRARPRAAGQRLARAALPHAQRDAMPVQHLQVASIHAAGKARVMLEQRPLRRHRRRLDVGHDLHGVRIAYRQYRYLCGFPVNFNSFYQRRTEGRGPHLDADFAVGLEPLHDRAGEGLDAEFALRGEAFLVHELHEAARAVAALLDLAAVGVEDAVAEVHAAPLRPLDHEDLVATDSQMSIRGLFQLLFIEIECRPGGIQDHEIVAGTLHLGTRKLHADCRTQAQMRSMPCSSSSGWMGSESTLFAAASAAGSVRPRFDGSYAGCRCKGSG